MYATAFAITYSFMSFIRHAHKNPIHKQCFRCMRFVRLAISEALVRVVLTGILTLPFDPMCSNTMILEAFAIVYSYMPFLCTVLKNCGSSSRQTDMHLCPCTSTWVVFPMFASIS
jgi:hypothetical protein